MFKAPAVKQEIEFKSLANYYEISTRAQTLDYLVCSYM